MIKEDFWSENFSFKTHWIATHNCNDECNIIILRTVNHSVKKISNYKKKKLIRFAEIANNNANTSTKINKYHAM